MERGHGIGKLMPPAQARFRLASIRWLFALLPFALSASCAAPASKPAAHQPANIPFALEGAYIVIDVEMDATHTLPFVFDTGLSNGNLITPKTATDLGLKPGAALGSIGAASGGRSQAALTTVASIRIGDARLTDPPFAIVDLPPHVTGRPGKTPVAGFIGAPLLKDAVLCIDYEHRVMQRWARADFDGSSRKSMAMSLNHELPTIIVDIDGRPATLIVDSGNNGAIVVFAAFAIANDFSRRYPDLTQQGGNDGRGSFQALSTDADSIKLSPDAAFENVPLTVIPQGVDPARGIDGLLGFEVLSRLNPCLDRDGGRLYFDSE